ncbi:hypothetical protein M0811_09347 [Anaeramoeba ignava]|uniref:HD domain-containing protein n=1 Tax=Anaeramoeba ignava TaxID=1746090 RepID=A0A9Q0LHQ8_ANAIG|nr:hypothetical protein M0811_09347 [Anaeramoeba ignava]
MDLIFQKFSFLFKIKQDVLQKWIQIINQKYNEKQRFYHNQNHIENILLIFNSFLLENDKFNEKSKQIIELSAIFHDLIYDPQSKENELNSVKLFKEFSKEINLENQMIEKIERIILATQENHAIFSTESDLELKIFLDLDYSILGSNKEEYQEYKNAIRKEYSHFNDKEFKEGRLKFIKNVLKNKIFLTDYFEDKFEEKAKKNLEEEKKELNL